MKIHCSVLAEDAIKAAIADYKRKQAEASHGNGDGAGAAGPKDAGAAGGL